MGNIDIFRYKKCESGFGIYEVLIAAAVLLFICSGLFYFSNDRKIRNTIVSIDSCNNAVADVISAIKTLDNQSIVRNWMPSLSSSPATHNPADPFCNTTDGRTAVCDNSVVVQPAVAGPTYVNQNDFRTHLNVRGSHTWAQNLYNANRATGICQTNGTAPQGMTLTAEQLGNLLPLKTQINAGAINYRLYIKDKAVACGTESNSRSAQYEIVASAIFRSTNGAISECQAAIQITNTTLPAPEPLSLIAVRNGAGVDIPSGYCTDRRMVDAGAGSDSSWQNIDIALPALRPGSILICRKNAYFADGSDAGVPRYHNCVDMTLSSGNVVLTPSTSTIAYSTSANPNSISPIVGLRNLADTGNSNLHEYEIRAVDVGGNVTNAVTANFLVHTPSCPDRSTYCASASPAVPGNVACTSCTSPPRPECSECWNTAGDISTQPYDDCLNGLCPVGTRTGFCDNTIAPLVCSGTNYPDDCGNMVCAGTRPSSCPPGPYTTFRCGEIVPGDCNSNCGTGTGPNCATFDPTTVECDCESRDACNNVCGKGTRNCPPGWPNPPALDPHDSVGCDCSTFVAANTPCNTNGPDSCGKPNTCGPGTQNCPACSPPPPPVVLGPCTEPVTTVDFMQCSNHSILGRDTTSKRRTITSNATCNTYTLHFDIVGHRHGGSGMFIQFGITGAPYYFRFQRNEDIHIVSAGSHNDYPMSGFQPTSNTIVTKATPGQTIEVNGSGYCWDSKFWLTYIVVPSNQ